MSGVDPINQIIFEWQGNTQSIKLHIRTKYEIYVIIIRCDVFLNKNYCGELAMIICPLCGAENKDNTQYCTNCGLFLVNHDGLVLAEGTILKRIFTIKRYLGSGGFGIVYEAYDNQRNQRYAIKELFIYGSVRKNNKVIQPITISDNEIQDYKNKFFDEVKIIKNINNLNLIKVYECFEENNTCYMVMDFIEGETLSSILKRKGNFSEEETKNIMKKILNGIKAIHEKKILHRDIKPENIMISNSEVKIVDFGAAREYISGKTVRMTKVFAPAYAPPEQLSPTGRFGPEIDIYALGVTMYELLSGDLPPNAYERLSNNINLNMNNIKAGDRIKKIIKKCLCINSNNRYHSIEELEDALFNKASECNIKLNSESANRNLERAIEEMKKRLI